MTTAQSSPLVTDLLHSGHKQWVTARETCDALGISKATLQNLSQQGVFKQGLHFYRVGLGSRGPRMFDIEACRQALIIRSVSHLNPLASSMTDHSSASIEDLLGEWWRDSYPHAAPINNATAGMMVAFASWVLAQQSQRLSDD